MSSYGICNFPSLPLGFHQFKALTIYALPSQFRTSVTAAEYNCRLRGIPSWSALPGIPVDQSSSLWRSYV